MTENDKTPRIAIETSLMLPYRGQQGEKLLKSLSKTLNHFENKHVTKVIYTGTKLGTNFSIKDTTLKEHQHNLVYEVKCPEPTCNSSYIGEVSRRLGERIKDHCGRDSKISCLNTRWSPITGKSLRTILRSSLKVDVRATITLEKYRSKCSREIGSTETF